MAGAALLAGLSATSRAEPEWGGEECEAAEYRRGTADLDCPADGFQVNVFSATDGKDSRSNDTSRNGSGNPGERAEGKKNKANFKEVKGAEEQGWISRALASEKSFAQWLTAGSAFGSLFASTIGIVLLWYTLRETRRAVRAADDAVAATYTASRDQSRAYVHVSDAEMFLGSNTAANPSISLTVHNTGATPARWFSIASQTLVRSEGDISPTLTEFDTPIIDDKRWGTVGSGMTLTARANIDEDSIRAAYPDRSKRAVFVAGAVRYETIFGEVFETEFMFARYGIPMYSAETIGQRPEGVMVTRENPIKMSRPICILSAYRRVPESGSSNSAHE